MKKQKFYVVWQGRSTGIFSTWESCKEQVENVEGAQYKSFESREEAEKALEDGFYKTIAKKKKREAGAQNQTIAYPTQHALVVDAAWNTKTGDMEYQGRHLQSGQLLFKKGPFHDATNNIGEFLAIVHALALAQKGNLGNIPIYSDSLTAISWVKRKKANTKLVATDRNKDVFELIQRAENWLNSQTFANPVLKWVTEQWGENPADFGRK
ncbi:MAG: viroplasmin family protein [Spirosomataceae bacterium]